MLLKPLWGRTNFFIPNLSQTAFQGTVEVSECLLPLSVVTLLWTPAYGPRFEKCFCKPVCSEAITVGSRIFHVLAAQPLSS